MEDEKILEKRVDDLERYLKKQEKLVDNLIDYLQRTDKNFHVDMQEFDNWEERLRQMKEEEDLARNLNRAKKLLRDEGYFIATNENEIDAQRLKSWVKKKGN